MDAKDDRAPNPFTDTLCSLEWIACAMDAARRYKEQPDDAEPAAASLAEPAQASNDNG